MKAFATILLFITLGAAFANKAVLQSLAEIDKDPFGNTILSAISLNLRAKTPIEDVSRLLKEILDDLLSDHQNLQSSFQTQSDNLHGAISDGESLIKTLDTSIANLQDSIQTDSQTQQTKETTLGSTQAALAFENNRLTQLENDFQATVPVLDADIDDLQRAITAVGNAYTRMQNYQSTQSGGVATGAFVEVASTTQKDMMSVSNTIQKMKKTLSKRSNLYTPLVRELLDLTVNMDQSKSERVISLLQQLSDLLQQALNAVQEERATFIANYKRNKEEAEANVALFTGQIAGLEQEIEDLKARISQAQSDLAATQDLRNDAQAKLDADRQSLERATNFFNDQNPRYENLIGLVRKIIDYFNSNVASVDEYTRSRLENTTF